MMNRIKLIKFILAGFLLIVCMTLPGELYQTYSNYFQDFYYTTFYPQKDTTAEEMLTALSDVAAKYNVSIFKKIKNTSSTFFTDLHIYADKTSRTYLEENCKIFSGYYSSIFSGSTSITFHDFDELTLELLKQEPDFYLLGDYNAVSNFKGELIDIYGGRFPSYERINTLSSSHSTIISVFAIFILLNLLLSYFDISFQRKEIFVRYTLGQSIFRIYLKNILVNSMFLILVGCTSSLFFKQISGNAPFYSLTPYLIITACLSEALIYLLIFKVNCKLALSDATMTADRKSLSGSYILQGICLILVIASISSNIANIYECLSYYRQKPFFEEHSDFYWYQGLQINEENTSNNTPVITEIFNNFSESMDIFYLCEDLTLGSGDKLYYYANPNTLSYLQSEFSVLNSIELDKDVYILIHKNEKLTDEEMEDLISAADSKPYEILYYSESADIITRKLDSEPITELVKKPIIVFHAHENEPLEPGKIKYEFFLCMMRTDHEVFEQFALEKNLTYSETNALGYFNYRWTILSRMLLLNLVLLLMMIAIELIVSYAVVSLEFKVNANELALKKIMGYTIFERFKKLFATIICIWSSSAVIMTIIFTFVKSSLIPYGLLGALIILALNFASLLALIIRFEKNNIPKILKGGAL